MPNSHEKQPGAARPGEKNLFIYLASTSERRREYLKKLGIPFRVVPSRYREPLRSRGTPHAVVLRHAVGKVRQARIPKRVPSAGRVYVLGADTIVFFRGRIIEKPKNLKAAKRQLTDLSGRSHWVYSGICLLDPVRGQMRMGWEKTRVYFKKWDSPRIDRYIERVKPLDKAGSYAIQIRPFIVRSYKGSRSNVVGLPLELLRQLLR